ncbi:hypothetical protein [Sulfurospirillum barnesii]|uniref:CobQ/CobB/MinD/ParA nucleotide binding domain-containing protein n=1 Tax=Sulfurospirillum barnesii (strain ATCC 700032 / DSM 10660 / SES-3) TaxID=760154 RepID=I3Y079_SULBS|nr:hypothetical protein [Sulfurospirillum barnesii]AFL69603.1 hypothetical protein Sulba_2333 [Sulfurospirillum barnesii SES-3]
MKKNVLVYNFKGGASKSTISSAVASYLQDATLIEIDYINQSDSRLDAQGFYESLQMDFIDETSESFFEFENLLLSPGIRIIDVGAVMLDRFHSAMKKSNLYDTLDLIIIPAMDGSEDFNVAIKFLENIKNEVDPQKIMFSFNRFNNFEYAEPKEQFETFFNNLKKLKKEYGIDLNDEANWFVVKDSKAIKKSRSMGVTLRSLIDSDVDAITRAQRAEPDDAIRLELTKQRGLVLNAQNLYREFIEPMMAKIANKLGA